MSTPDPYRSFLVRLPLALVAGLVLWLLIRPALDGAVTALAQTLVRAFEMPRVTRLVAVEHLAEVHRADFRAGSTIPTVALTAVHFNTIVLLALFLSLPRPFARRRLERLVMAWSLLYLTQSLNLVFHVKTLYATGLGVPDTTGIGEWSRLHYSDLARNVYGYLRHFTDLPGRLGFPFLLWLGCSWESVMTMVASSPGGAEARPRSRDRYRPRRR